MMKSISDEIIKHKCSRHNKTYTVICIENNCQHPQRMMCDECVDLNNTNGLINIEQAFDFMGQQEAKTQQGQAILWQQYMRHKQEILQLLKQLESLIETCIQSILGNETMRKLQVGFLDKPLDNNDDMQRLGQLLIGKLQIDDLGQYKFTQLNNQISNLAQQEGYIESHEIFKGYEQARNVLNQKLNQIQDQIRDNNILRKEHERYLQQQDMFYYHYRHSQTIQVPGCCMYVYFNHNETQIAAAVDKSIILFNQQQNGQWILDNQILLGHTKKLWQVKYNHDSTQIASCSKDGLILIWTKQQDGKWSIQDSLSQHSNDVNSICFNHDSTKLASGSDDNSINIYALIRGRWYFKQQLLKHTHWVFDVLFSHDSKLLASGSRDSIINLWELNSVGQYAHQQKLEGHTQHVYSMAFNSRSTKLVSGSRDNTIKIWSINNENIWECSQILIGHNSFIRSIKFNQLSNMIVSGSEDNTIKIWRMNEQLNWECTQTINQHKSWVLSSIISSDSTMMISGSNDHTIMIHKR